MPSAAVLRPGGAAVQPATGEGEPERRARRAPSFFRPPSGLAPRPRSSLSQSRIEWGRAGGSSGPRAAWATFWVEGPLPAGARQQRRCWPRSLRAPGSPPTDGCYPRVIAEEAEVPRGPAGPGRNAGPRRRGRRSERLERRSPRAFSARWSSSRRPQPGFSRSGTRFAPKDRRYRDQVPPLTEKTHSSVCAFGDAARAGGVTVEPLCLGLEIVTLFEDFLASSVC